MKFVIMLSLLALTTTTLAEELSYSKAWGDRSVTVFATGEVIAENVVKLSNISAQIDGKRKMDVVANMKTAKELCRTLVNGTPQTIKKEKKCAHINLSAYNEVYLNMDYLEDEDLPCDLVQQNAWNRLIASKGFVSVTCNISK